MFCSVLDLKADVQVSLRVLCSSFLNLINLGNPFSFVQRPVRRPKMAYSVPSRSLWRRSCRRPGFGRVKTRVRSCVWGSRSRAAAGHAEDTVPYPENWTDPKKKHHPERDDYGPETERRREKEKRTERWNFKKENSWRGSVGREDFAVCTLPFQPSPVTPFFLKHE